MTTADYLITYNIKPSVQRIAIMDYLKEHKTHPTADEIFNALSPSIPTLSKTTVYNTLKLFTEQGAALCISIEEKNARFDGEVSNHAHFICLGCGCIYDICMEQLESVTVKNIDELAITETHLYYKGYCKKCKEAN
jgi:Fur family ferric uptake transcriptional regulator/Fur family peroxide stress response transcriptional regulator